MSIRLYVPPRPSVHIFDHPDPIPHRAHDFIAGLQRVDQVDILENPGKEGQQTSDVSGHTRTLRAGQENIWSTGLS